MRRTAYELPITEREGAYRYCRSADGAFVLHEWALDPTDDTDDMSVVEEANPASWQTEEALRRRHDSPSMTPWAWGRFACGLWVAGEDSAISAKEWSRCGKPGLEIPAGADGVFVGVDLGWRWDTTAIVAIRQEGNAIHVHPPAILTPPQDGTSLDAEDVFGACEAMAERWPGLTFVLDPEAGGEQLAQRLDRELDNASVLTHSQKAGPMCDASQQLSEAIADGTLQHPADSLLTRHVLSAAAKFYGVGWRLVKQKAKSLPIDGAVALAMGIRVLRSTQDDKPESTMHVSGPGAAMFGNY